MSRWIVHSRAEFRALHALTQYQGMAEEAHDHEWHIEVRIGTESLNTEGYALALEQFDKKLPQIIKRMSSRDILMITADHGCDPTYVHHTDHTREYVPLLVYGEAVKQGVDLGIRDTFADCGQTIADFLGAGKLLNGKSFKDDIVPG